MADIARIYIGIGSGCGVNPGDKEIKQAIQQWVKNKDNDSSKLS